jgi:hypothetical protein
VSAPWQAPDLTAEERGRLLKWLPAEAEPHPLAVAGYLRNVKRHAEQWGPVLIAALIERGVLESEGNPLDALDELLAPEGKGWVDMPPDAPFRCGDCEWHGKCGRLDAAGNCPACGGQVEPL